MSIYAMRFGGTCENHPLEIVPCKRCATEMASFGVIEQKPRGMDDPDYARMFTQMRVIAWQYGFALIAHGSFTRDLDVLMVPWEERAFDGAVPAIINRMAEITGTKVKGDPTDKPHGRKAWTLYLPDTVRWVDLSVMPCAAKAVIA